MRPPTPTETGRRGAVYSSTVPVAGFRAGEGRPTRSRAGSLTASAALLGANNAGKTTVCERSRPRPLPIEWSDAVGQAAPVNPIEVRGVHWRRTTPGTLVARMRSANA